MDYYNRAYESASTYWDVNKNDSENKQKKAGEIAEILNKAGCDLTCGSMHGWSIWKMAKEYNLTFLRTKLKELKRANYKIDE